MKNKRKMTGPNALYTIIISCRVYFRPMNKRNKSWRWSQVLALFVLTAAVFTMAAPFRGGGGMVKMQSAAMVPLLTTNSLAHGASFQARSLAQSVGCSGESLFRSAPRVKHVVRREILIRKVVSAEPVNFHAPRTGWTHLSQQVRAGLDRLAEGAETRTLELRSTGTLRGDMVDLARRANVLGGADQMSQLGAAILVGNGRGADDGAVQLSGRDQMAGPLVLYLVGDFNQVGVTRSQWEALDEVLDYLRMKWGEVKVSVRPHAGGAAGTRWGLGTQFPTEQFLRALQPPGPTPAG
jgi:hypothetical protein